MDILISNSSDKPIYEQITSQIKALIMRGELASGEPLPSIRHMAKELKVSVITTKRAYADLERDGFIETIPGKGSFVASKNMAIIREEQFKAAEALLAEAVDIAKRSGISLTELTEILTLLYEEEER